MDRSRWLVVTSAVQLASDIAGFVIAAHGPVRRVVISASGGLRLIARAKLAHHAVRGGQQQRD